MMTRSFLRALRCVRAIQEPRALPQSTEQRQRSSSVPLRQRHPGGNFGLAGAFSLRHRPDETPVPDRIAIQRVTAGKGSGAPPRRRAPARPLALEQADDETLLATRLCDLPVRLDGSLMDRRARRLHRELQARGIVALPHVYLSEEFFNPDGMLGFAVPFYLAHPRLMAARAQPDAGGGRCRRSRVPTHLSSRGRARHRRGLQAARADPLPAAVRRSGGALSGCVHAARGEPRVRHQSDQLVRAGAPGRGFRRDLRGLAQPVHRLARGLQRAGRRWKSSSTSTR